jgi:ABC-type xylose transport system substrate-binding protein
VLRSCCQHGGIAKEVKIGMAIDDLRLERWQKDRDILSIKPNH